MIVWILEGMDFCDDQLNVQGVFSTEEKAEKAKKKFLKVYPQGEALYQPSTLDEEYDYVNE